MSRPLRIEYPGACYHVVNRGNQRNRIFFSSDHYELFLEKLRVFSEEFVIRIRCYCLMPNHFHIYLQTPDGNLSRFMQSLLTSFCYSLNRIRGKSGHVFQGRFKCHLVEDAAYSMAVSRYIHLNPVRTADAKSFPVDEKRRMLDSFKWSSYAAYVGKAELPEWLDYGSVMDKFEGENNELKSKAYNDYVEEGLLRDLKNPFGSAGSQIILGGKEFTERIKRKYLLNLNVADSKGQRDLVRLKGSFTFEEVLARTARCFKCSEDELLKKRSLRKDPRKALMYLACKYCKSNLSLTEIGRRMSVGQSGLVRSKNRFASELEDNTVLAGKIHEIEKEMKSIAGV